MLGGAVMVQVVPEQLTAGKIVLAPIVLPWVLDVARDSLILMVTSLLIHTKDE